MMVTQQVVSKLRQLSLFQNLAGNTGEEELKRILKIGAELGYKKGKVLCRQDAPVTQLFLILEGKVRLTRIDRQGVQQHVGDLEAGEAVGERGLLVDTRYEVTAAALTDVRVFSVERSAFLGLLNQEQIVTLLQQLPLFEGLNYPNGELELYRIAKITNAASYDAGEVIFQQGQSSNRLFLVLEGQVRLTRIDREGLTRHLRDLTWGEAVGETGLLVGDFHDATAETLSATRVLYLERTDFAELLSARGRLRRQLKVNPELDALRSVPQFDWLREGELVVFAVQRHWAYLLRSILPLLIVDILVAALGYILLKNDSSAGRLFGGILGLFVVASVGFMAWEYLNWRDDRFVLTTQRIVHGERVWPVRESFEEGTLENIQDVHEVQTGITANLLNFGDVILQTAGETVQIDLRGVPKPARLRELIFREIERNRARDVLSLRGAIREKLENRLHLAPPPPPSEMPVIKRASRSPVWVTLGSIRDYFFPASWRYSEDRDTILWRRFWLPGFIRYLAVFIPLAGITLLGVGFSPTFLLDSKNSVWLMLWLLTEALLFGILLWFIEDWRNDYFQITPNRIIVVDRKPLLLQESRRETTLDRIQNISFDVPDLPARIFKYGHVTLETAGTMGQFQLKWVRHPEKVQAEISRRQQAYARQRREAEAEQRQEEMLSWFATYDDLRNQRPGRSGPAPAPPQGTAAGDSGG